MKKDKDFNIKENFCPRCGCLEVEVTSDGTILCKNPHCLAVSKMDYENNELTLKFKVK